MPSSCPVGATGTIPLAMKLELPDFPRAFCNKSALATRSDGCRWWYKNSWAALSLGPETWNQEIVVKNVESPAEQDFFHYEYAKYSKYACNYMFDYVHITTLFCNYMPHNMVNYIPSYIVDYMNHYIELRV